MLDIELLRSFVSVVDAGGFTRAGERVHRTQSTVSQQVKRLEDSVGRPLLVRNGKQATLTEEGERLLSYARRILALEQEARDVVARPVVDGVVRLGIPEDFAAYRLTELLSDFVRSRPTLRLDVRSGLSVGHKRALERRRARSCAVQAQCRRRRRHRVLAGKAAMGDEPQASSGLEPRSRSASRLRARLSLSQPADPFDRSRRPHLACRLHQPKPRQHSGGSFRGPGREHSPDVAILPEHRVIERAHGFPPITNTELALVAAENASPATRRLGELLADFCAGLGARRAA